MFERLRGLEWPTLVLLALCYALWALGTTVGAAMWLPLGMVMVVIGAALHSSLTHEMLHGHPFTSPVWNAVLVFPALSLVVPYLRFKDTHMAHHRDAILTDPYDDPESNFMDPKVWGRLPRWGRALLRVNNTLAGRMLLGPLIGTLGFVMWDARALRRGDRRVALGWLLHVPAVGVVVWWMVAVGQMPVWAFLVSTYAALSVLKIRTFLEHRAHETAQARTVIIEDRGLLALLFLNNNFHIVHHMHAMVPWYRLPALYRENRDRYLSRNGGYRYATYGEVFRRYFWRAKDPVPHPLYPES
ncbi:fatty acid desaturase [Antarctobacter heliothermus]|uniref:Fatty acid desaturase n=1 Tax=Antarctobacter heliothermus TaxID=74033 RepID=A0A222DYT1_9RHOB|nr:fatty acid desaturase [Antarctobacter heliothermus]ASP19109.1 fatty acid desaturase [Antarctobacter heliothermus]MBT54076.1 fatty acid desaturase [Mameliella sp.]|tara:strand:+ start:4429 stop:5328 length:900 start_codon:yes stop_codon:yes gene_type:complete